MRPPRPLQPLDTRQQPLPAPNRGRRCRHMDKPIRLRPNQCLSGELRCILTQAVTTQRRTVAISIRSGPASPLLSHTQLTTNIRIIINIEGRFHSKMVDYFSYPAVGRYSVSRIRKETGSWVYRIETARRWTVEQQAIAFLSDYSVEHAVVIRARTQQSAAPSPELPENQPFKGSYERHFKPATSASLSRAGWTRRARSQTRHWPARVGDGSPCISFPRDPVLARWIGSLTKKCALRPLG